MKDEVLTKEVKKQESILNIHLIIATIPQKIKA